MKIIFISALYYPYIGGGAEISNKLLVEGIKKCGIDIEVVTLGEKNEECYIDGIKINRVHINKILNNYLRDIQMRRENTFYNKIVRFLFKFTSPLNLLLIRKVKKIMKNLDGDIIHTSSINLFFPELWWKTGCKKSKIVHTLRDPYLLYFSGIYNTSFIMRLINYIHRIRYKHFTSKYIDCIHSPSQYMINLHIENNFNFEKFKVIYNTVDIFSKQSNFSEKTYDISYVGALGKHKGILTLLKAHFLNSKIKMLFIGEGPLKDEISHSNLETTGWMNHDEALKKVEISKILVLPSEWDEAFGRVLIEAVACGTIPIGSNRGAIPEVLFNDSRYIFNSGDPQHLLEKITRVLNLNEVDYYSEISDLQRKMERYSYENHINEFKKFYYEILKEDPK